LSVTASVLYIIYKDREIKKMEETQNPYTKILTDKATGVISLNLHHHLHLDEGLPSPAPQLHSYDWTWQNKNLSKNDLFILTFEIPTARIFRMIHGHEEGDQPLPPIPRV